MRSKGMMLLGIAVVSALSLFAATQTWVTISFTEGAAAFDSLLVTGQELSPTLSPVAIAGLAAALALTIAGRVFRYVLGGLIALFGVGIAFIGFGVHLSPRDGVESRVSEFTGLTGTAQEAIIQSVTTSAWPLVLAILGLLLATLGLLVLFFAPRWPLSGRKYDAKDGQRSQNRADDAGEPDRISEWDAMNDGEDPTQLEDTR